ncbi:MAG: hypothetical protein ISR96_03250 [Nitrospira sp.]|nr:hypothetical protein [bacterium]MBL7048531.1 hypothetical protein [Nitrospira sp.]
MSNSGDYHLFEVKNILVKREMPVSIQLNKMDGSLIIDNKGGNSLFDLNVETRINGIKATRKIINIPLTANKVTQLLPKAWSSIEDKFILQEKDTIDGSIIKSSLI